MGCTPSYSIMKGGIIQWEGKWPLVPLAYGGVSEAIRVQYESEELEAIKILE